MLDPKCHPIGMGLFDARLAPTLREMLRSLRLAKILMRKLLMALRAFPLGLTCFFFSRLILARLILIPIFFARLILGRTFPLTRIGRTFHARHAPTMRAMLRSLRLAKRLNGKMLMAM